MKTAIVYDWIDKWGGVERVLLMLHKIFPDAEFYTSYYDPEGASWAKDLKIRTSFIQKLPGFIKKNRILSLFFYPYAFEGFRFDDYDLVISVSSSFAKSVITKPETLHICYLLTPTRYFWIDTPNWAGIFRKHYQNWDYIAAQRPDKIISISKTVQERCEKFYNRDSEVIYPPFDIEYWDKIKNQIQKPIRQAQAFGSEAQARRGPEFIEGQVWNDNKHFFLVVSRLEPYKMVDLAIKVFNQIPDKNLVVVGKGTQEDKLKNMAGKNILFLKNQTDQELAVLYKNAEALIMPQEEDFGYVSLEAQFFGCPVISYNKGGATETIIEGKTGTFFKEPTVKALSDIIKKFKRSNYESSNFRRWSGNTTLATFKEKITQAV